MNSFPIYHAFPIMDDPNFFANNPDPVDDQKVVHVMDIPPAGPAVYPPVVARNEARDFPAPPGFMQFAMTDDQMPAGSTRNDAFVQSDTEASATTSRVGEFCYMCYASSRVKSAHYTMMANMWNDWHMNHTLNATAVAIQKYYNRHVRNSIPDRPEWRTGCVEQHFTEHIINKSNILAKRARQLNDIANKIVITSSRVDENGRLVRVADSSVKSLLGVIAMEQSILDKLLPQ